MELKEVINQRFLQAVDRLIKDGHARSYRSFCQSIHVNESTHGDIKGGRRSVTIELLEALCEEYGVSYMWMLDKSN